MKRHATPDSVNLTPMIDIVFQMIIFFVFTLDLEREKFDPKIQVPEAVHLEAIKEYEPATVYAQVLASGNIKVGTSVTDPTQFRYMIRQAIKRYGMEIPVMVYGDAEAKHGDFRRVMDICSEEGLSRMQIVGLIEKSQKKQQ